jgi:hypothetical protein
VSSALWLLVPVLAGYAAFWALFAVNDPYCWEYVVRPDGTMTFDTVSEQEALSGRTLGPGPGEAGGGCDDRVTPLESVASLALVALAVTAAVLPRRGRRAQTAAG